MLELTDDQLKPQARAGDWCRRGIAGGTVRQLVAAGADVIASGRSQEALSALAEQAVVRTLPFDLASEESLRDALDGLDFYDASTYWSTAPELP